MQKRKGLPLKMNSFEDQYARQLRSSTSLKQQLRKSKKRVGKVTYVPDIPPSERFLNSAASSGHRSSVPALQLSATPNEYARQPPVTPFIKRLSLPKTLGDAAA